MRLIGIKTGMGDRFVMKNLHDNTWYPFGAYMEPTEANGWNWLTEQQKEEENACREMYASLAENIDEKQGYKSNLDITVNCIVGKNGSGKSSLLDILYRIINNFSFKLFDQLWKDNDLSINPQRGHELSEAQQFDATLFFETDGNVGSIRYSYGHCEFNYHSPDDVLGIKSFKLENQKISKVQLEDITKHLFYTIASNYSLHSLNEEDYSPNWLWIGTDKEIDGSWLKGLFHKNDGYVVPIVMVPFRDQDGIIDIRKENELAKTRLATMAILFASQRKFFFDSYSPKHLVYRFRHDCAVVYSTKFNELYRQSLPLNNQTSILKRKINSEWRHELSENYSAGYRKLDKRVREAMLSYLTYKTLKTCLYYRKYGELLGIRAFDEDQEKIVKKKKKSGFYLDYKEGSIKKIVRAIRVDDASDHINQKIQQMLFSLNHQIYITEYLDAPDDWPGDPTELTAYGWSMMEVGKLFGVISDGTKQRVKYNTYAETFLRMPPVIFDWDISFTKRGKDEEYFSQMSSGEKQFLHSLSYIIYHLNNLQSVKDEGIYRVKYHNACLIFDEAELYYHPDFQRQFISRLIKALSSCHINPDLIGGINIIIVTHSPFVLSDVPLNNTLYLKDGSVDPEHNQTFCGNVHELLGDNFFMNYSVGEVARQNVEEIIRLYNAMENPNMQEKIRCKFQKNTARYRFVASIVADDYLRLKIEDMVNQLEARYCMDTEIKSLDRKIGAVRKQLQILENMRHQLNPEAYNDQNQLSGGSQ